MLNFDHSYTVDQNHKFRTKLSKAGFFINRYKTEHPGGLICKFIPIAKPKSSNPIYLEFIHFKNSKKADKYPGISFSSAQKLTFINKKLIRNGIKTKIEHRNYNWKENNQDYLPGWNFLTFPDDIKQGTFLWLTEYERHLKRTKNALNGKNPNGVYCFDSINIELSKRDFVFYKKLFGKPRNNSFRLENQTTLSFKISKSTKINSIVVVTKNLKRIISKYAIDEIITYKNKQAILIKNPNPKMWDVIIIERK